MSIPFSPISPRTPHTPFHHHDLLRSLQASPTPSPPKRKLPTELSLLVPATRWTDELEDAWRSQLGHLEVLEEVKLKGYQLHGVKDWLMQTNRLVQTVVNYTGVDSHHVTAYRLAPAADVSEEQAQQGINNAIAMLTQTSHAKTKITEYGWIMVTSLSSFSLGTFVISSGDLREAMPTIIVNTNLRRLGCSGRAELRLDAPSDAFRRKFSEMYHIDCPQPQHGTPLSRSTSPSTSPTKHRHPHSTSPIALRPDNIDPFPIAVIELGKLIQSALALFGYFKQDQQRVEPDGLLCDGVMRAFELWSEDRRLNGADGGVRTSDRRSDEVITPSLVALLLSSVTAVRYKLATVGQNEKVPKDPFTDMGRFQNSWRGWQLSGGKNHRVESLYITPSLQARLDAAYDKIQSRNPDRYKNPINKIRSQVAHATSALSLKASADDQSSSRHRDPSRRMTYDSAGDSEGDAGYTNRHDGPSGFALESPTGDLELYVRNITKLRQKDLESVGGIRVARLWTGKVNTGDVVFVDGHRRDRRLDPLRRRNESREFSDRDLKSLGERHADPGDESKRGSLRSTMSKTHLAIGKLARSKPIGDTSDSDIATPSSASQGRMPMALKIPSRKPTNGIPSVMEPDLEEVDEGLSTSHGKVSAYGTSPPGPSSYESRLQAPLDFATSRSTRTASTRPSINTTISFSGSDATSLAAYGAGSRRGSRAYEAQVSTVDESVDSFSKFPTAASTRMMRTASDGAEVSSEGVEFTVKRPRGALVHTRHGHDVADELGSRRRHSLSDRLAYVDMPRDDLEHMVVDVDVCRAVLELLQRERQMQLQIKYIETLEQHVNSALDDVRSETAARQARVVALQTEAQSVIAELPDPKEEFPNSLREVKWLEEELSWNVDNTSNLFRSHQRKELDRLLHHLNRKGTSDECTQVQDKEGDPPERPAAVSWWKWW